MPIYSEESLPQEQSFRAVGDAMLRVAGVSQFRTGELALTSESTEVSKLAKGQLTALLGPSLLSAHSKLWVGSSPADIAQRSTHLVRVLLGKDPHAYAMLQYRPPDHGAEFWHIEEKDLQRKAEQEKAMVPWTVVTSFASRINLLGGVSVAALEALSKAVYHQAQLYHDISRQWHTRGSGSHGSVFYPNIEIAPQVMRRVDLQEEGEALNRALSVLSGLRTPGMQFGKSGEDFANEMVRLEHGSLRYHPLFQAILRGCSELRQAQSCSESEQRYFAGYASCLREIIEAVQRASAESNDALWTPIFSFQAGHSPFAKELEDGTVISTLLDKANQIIASASFLPSTNAKAVSQIACSQVATPGGGYLAKVLAFLFEKILEGKWFQSHYANRFQEYQPPLTPPW